MTLQFFGQQHGGVTIVVSPTTGKLFFTCGDNTRGTVQQEGIFTVVDNKPVLATGVTVNDLVVNNLPANAEGETAYCIVKKQTENTLALC